MMQLILFSELILHSDPINSLSFFFVLFSNDIDKEIIIQTLRSWTSIIMHRESVKKTIWSTDTSLRNETSIKWSEILSSQREVNQNVFRLDDRLQVTTSIVHSHSLFKQITCSCAWRKDKRKGRWAKSVIVRLSTIDCLWTEKSKAIYLTQSVLMPGMNNRIMYEREERLS